MIDKACIKQKIKKHLSYYASEFQSESWKKFPEFPWVVGVKFFFPWVFQVFQGLSEPCSSFHFKIINFGAALQWSFSFPLNKPCQQSKKQYNSLRQYDIMKSYGKTQQKHYHTDDEAESSIEKFFNHLYHLWFCLFFFLFAYHCFLNVNNFGREISRFFCFTAITKKRIKTF